MGAKMGAIIYYLVEIAIYLVMSYILFLRPKLVVKKLFKKTDEKYIKLSYALGVVAMFQVFSSVRHIASMG